MKKLWIALTAALGLALLPVTYARADYEDYLDERAEFLEEAAEEGFYPALDPAPTRVYVSPVRRVYYDDFGRRVVVRERPVIREYHRTYFID